MLQLVYLPWKLIDPVKMKKYKTLFYSQKTLFFVYWLILWATENALKEFYPQEILRRKNFSDFNLNTKM